MLLPFSVCAFVTVNKLGTSANNSFLCFQLHALSVPSSREEHHKTFHCQLSFQSSCLWQLLRLFLLFMTEVFKNVDEVFNQYLIEICLFLLQLGWDYESWRKTTKHYFIISNVHLMSWIVCVHGDLSHQFTGWGSFSGFSTVNLITSPDLLLAILFGKKSLLTAKF